MTQEQEVVITLSESHIEKMKKLSVLYSLENQDMQKLWELAIDFYQKLISQRKAGKVVGVETLGTKGNILPFETIFEAYKTPNIFDLNFDLNLAKGKLLNFSYILLEITWILLRQGGKIVLVDMEQNPPTGFDYKHEVLDLVKQSQLN